MQTGALLWDRCSFKSKVDKVQQLNSSQLHISAAGRHAEREGHWTAASRSVCGAESSAGWLLCHTQPSTQCSFNPTIHSSAVLPFAKTGWDQTVRWNTQVPVIELNSELRGKYLSTWGYRRTHKGLSFQRKDVFELTGRKRKFQQRDSNHWFCRISSPP